MQREADRELFLSGLGSNYASTIDCERRPLTSTRRADRCSEVRREYGHVVTFPEGYSAEKGKKRCPHLPSVEEETRMLDLRDQILVCDLDPLLRFP